MGGTAIAKDVFYLSWTIGHWPQVALIYLCIRDQDVVC